MAFRDEFEAYIQAHPYTEINIDGINARYLLCGNEHSDQTLVYLVGGGGYSEYWFKHILSMEQDYRILTFDYPIGVNTLEDLACYIMKLIATLEIEKPVFIGASLGGILAQVIARSFPEKIAGVCLYSTCSLSKISLDGLVKKYKNFAIVPFIMRIMPYKMFNKISTRNSFKSVDTMDIDDEGKQWMTDFFTWLYGNFTKEYDMHIVRLLIDVVKLTPVTKEAYAKFDEKSLLILPISDEAFPKEAQQDLLDMMPRATVKMLDGGHIATIYKVDDYVNATRDFLEELS